MDDFINKCALTLFKEDGKIHLWIPLFLYLVAFPILTIRIIKNHFKKIK